MSSTAGGSARPGDGVTAIVVTYHPDEDAGLRLQALRPQVEHLVVVDNGSSAEELQRLRTATCEQRVELIENGENLGIATALNVGVLRALEKGSRWVLLFDQDSQVTEGFVAGMLNAFATSPWGDRLAILVPQYRDVRLGLPIPSIRVRDGIEAAMTSGSLIPVRVFQQHGLFREELFIDAVDYEYSLRLRKAGKVIEETAEATLLHEPGAPVLHRFAGQVMFRTANYSPVRRYYQERNKIWVTRRYLFDFPVFCMKLMMFSAKDFTKIVLAEQNKRVKMRYFLRGMVDGLRNRMGRLD
ncbi:MAG TPA: glycosyltransferase family 2 protein [Acidobacteriaceae bacterium]